MTRSFFCALRPVPALATSLALLVFGCADESKNDLNNITPMPNTNKPATTSNATSTSSGTSSATSADTSSTSGTATTKPTLSKTFCRNLTDKGVVDAIATEKVEFEGDTTTMGMKSGYDSFCGVGGGAVEHGFYFQAAGDMSIEIVLESASQAGAWVIDAHKGSCQDYVSIVREGKENNGCTTGSSLRTDLIKGETLFVAAEPRMRNEFGTFKLTAKLTPIVCKPVGEQTCSGMQVKVCESGGRFEATYPCIEGCQANTCIGDVCDNAKTWTRDELLTEAKNFTGPSTGYRDRFNFKTATMCKNPDSEVIPGNPKDPDANPDPPVPAKPFAGISTPGQDVVFKLTGLKKGDLLTVRETESNTDAAIAVLDTCDLATCHVAIDLGDELLDWSVPKDGDYTVIVDRTTSDTKKVAVTIGLKEAMK